MVISIDFIEQLPGSSTSTTILVVVDWLSKYAAFISTHDKIICYELAQLFLTHIFSKHSVPFHVTSDCSSEFISHFLQSLNKVLNMCLLFTSRHTQRVMNRLSVQIKHSSNISESTVTTNRTTGYTYLLLLAEFAYNNTPSTTTGVSPFFVNKGYHPNLALHPKQDLSSARAQEFTINLDNLH